MKTIRLILLSILFLPTLTFGVDLQNIFVQSVGGPSAVDSLRAMTGYRAEGTLTLNGQPGTVVEIFMPPNLYYVKFDFGAFSLVQAYDGQTAWQQDQNGNITNLEGYEKREVLKNLYFVSNSFLFDDRIDGSAEYLGDTTVLGKPFYKISFRVVETDTILGLFGQTDSLLTYVIGRMDNIRVITELGDYQTFGGTLVPTWSLAYTEGVPLNIEARLTGIAMNGAISKTVFSKPTTTREDFRFGDSQKVVKFSVPINYENGHIRVQASINGKKKAWFLLDTGASTSMFHTPMIADLNLTKVGAMAARGISGAEEITLVKIDSISVGELTLFNSIAGTLDLSTIARSMEVDDFGGLLGYDFISRFPLEINYEDETLILYNQRGTILPKDGTAVSFHLASSVPVVKAAINGVEGDFLIDLGNAFGLILHQHFFEQNNMEDKLDNIQTMPGSMYGISGATKIRSATAATFQIGDIKLESVEVVIPDSQDGISGSIEIAGIIGNRFLEKFRVVLDYANSVLILYPND